MRFLRRQDEDPLRDQPAGGDKENPRLPRIAVETTAYLPRTTRRSFLFLIQSQILQRAQSGSKSKRAKIFRFFPPNLQ